MVMVASLALGALLVSGWSTCTFPQVDWLAYDKGVGESATQRVAGMGAYAYIGGYTKGWIRVHEPRHARRTSSGILHSSLSSTASLQSTVLGRGRY